MKHECLVLLMLLRECLVLLLTLLPWQRLFRRSRTVGLKTNRFSESSHGDVQILDTNELGISRVLIPQPKGFFPRGN
jgi:hypothetical protein